MHGERFSGGVLCGMVDLNSPKPDIYGLNSDYVMEQNSFTESVDMVGEPARDFADKETAIILNDVGAPLPNVGNNNKAEADTGGGSTTPGTVTLTPIASKRKQKTTAKVSILNVEIASPIPEGVNTPLSIAICKKHGFNPTELIPRDLCAFMEPAVSPKLADVRYQCYEKRRKAHMTAVLPERLESEKLVQSSMENTHADHRDCKALKCPIAAEDSALRQKRRSNSSSCNSKNELNVSAHHQNQKQRNGHKQSNLSRFPDSPPLSPNVNNPLSSIRNFPVERHSSICSAVKHPVRASKTRNLQLEGRSSHPLDENTFRGSIAYSNQFHDSSTKIKQELQVLDKVLQHEKRAARTIQEQRESMERAVELHFLKNQEKLMNAQQNYKMTRLKHDEEDLGKIKRKESHIHAAEPLRHGVLKITPK